MALQRLNSLATTNLTIVKAGAGSILSGIIGNTSSSAKYLKVYDKATAPVLASDVPQYTLLLPAGGSIRIEAHDVTPYVLGLAYAITGAPGDTDATAVAVNDVVGFLKYK